ncbi:hypothetical protein GCM10010400_58250 [Streptomyces aculeolatus]|uniref:hypothetical protein n=1 Tax=Streptomyces aculeolatus TaxID=270689 RepID=UPI001CEDD98A|nr:hypothetical protein [Streptomyces aculeolatus]
MSAAAELRAAAQKLRALAEAAAPGPWHATEYEAGVDVLGFEAGIGTSPGERDIVDSGYEGGGVERLTDADFIAAMHPGVALALAAWLESEAARHEACATAAKEIWVIADHPDAVAWLASGPGAVKPEALAVARAIGGQQP